MRIVDAGRMRALDARTINELGLPGMVLMERAALGVFEAAERLIGARSDRPRRAVVLVGPGNNGGDGSAVARMLACAGWRVTLVLAADPDRITGDALANYQVARRLDIEMLDVIDHRVEAALLECDLCVDALLGIGLRAAPCGAVGAAVSAVNRARTRRGFAVLAVDIPTGVDADTGAVPGAAIAADETIAFGHAKWGHMLPPGVEFAGALRVTDIGIPPEYERSSPQPLAVLIDVGEARRRWMPTSPTAHKGVHGHVLVIGGSPGTPGAAVLSARAALRAGAGLVTVAGPPAVAQAVVAHSAELMTADRASVAAGVDERFDAIVFGPGVGLESEVERLLDMLLAECSHRPVVVDADGLTLLARRPRPLGACWILTPHPAELARLLGVPTADVVADLPAAAARCASDYGCVVVAKTAGAVIAGAELAFVRPGHPGMATAGSGDVLAGVLGAMAVRHPTFDAACVGTWLHAAAGAHAGETQPGPSMIASDIIAALPLAYAELNR